MDGTNWTYKTLLFFIRGLSCKEITVKSEGK